MQGIHEFIPTDVKIGYLNQLLRVGFHTLDCGSFVSPKAIPQMRDTHEVLEHLDLVNSQTRLSVIVANKQGIDLAVKEEKVTYLGYPFSISEEFQQRNTNRSIMDSIPVVEYLMERTEQQGKECVVYISMGFGNPYNEKWSPEQVVEWVGRLGEIGIRSFSISDTVGVSTPKTITQVYEQLNNAFPEYEYGAHFHTRPDNWEEKVDAAWKSGCRRFDGAIKGFGGCPMAKDELVGNMPTESLLHYFTEHNVDTGLDVSEFEKSLMHAAQVFS